MTTPTPDKQTPDRRPSGKCDEPGPYEAHCTEPPAHRWSCYDATEDVSWNDRQDWQHKHADCPDDGIVSEER